MKNTKKSTALIGTVLFLLAALPGCAYQGSFSGTYRKNSFPSLSSEERARIHDISFPLEVELTKVSFTEKQMVLAYKTDMTQEKLISLYRAGMEYWGWDELGIVRAAESSLVFSKPSKVCTIMLRPEGNQTRVLIFETDKN